MKLCGAFSCPCMKAVRGGAFPCPCMKAVRGIPLSLHECCAGHSPAHA